MPPTQNKYSIDDLFRGTVPNGLPQAFGAPVFGNTGTFRNGFTEQIDPHSVGTGEIGEQTFNVGRDKTLITLYPGDDIQQAIDKLRVLGGGIVRLQPGTYDVITDITLYSSIYLTGINTQTTVIDFGGSAKSVLVQGSNAYTTGTVSISNNGTTVTGSGTSWLANATAGQEIMLSGIWYTIANVATNTSLTITLPYAGSDLSGATYTIATIITDVRILDLTVQNSASAGIKYQYAGRELIVDHVYTLTNLIGIQADTLSQFEIKASNFFANYTGVSWTNTHFGTFSVGAVSDSLASHNLVLSSCSNLFFFGNFFFNGVGDGINMTSVTDSAFTGNSVKQNGGQGIEFVSGCDNVTFNQGAIEDNASDGAKFTATSDNCFITTSSISGNGGYGVNIATASCDNNILGLNNFSSNTSGNLNNLGTNTVVGLNVGV